MEITPEMIYAQKKITENILKEDEETLKRMFGDETVKFMKNHGIEFNLTEEEKNTIEKVNEKIHKVEDVYKSEFPEYDMNNKSDRQAFREVYLAFHAEELVKEGLMDKCILSSFQMDRREIEDYLSKSIQTHT